MTDEIIEGYIAIKEAEKKSLQSFWKYINERKDRVKPETWNELYTIISSDLAQIQKSIDDHVKLLQNKKLRNNE